MPRHAIEERSRKVWVGESVAVSIRGCCLPAIGAYSRRHLGARIRHRNVCPIGFASLTVNVRPPIVPAMVWGLQTFRRLLVIAKNLESSEAEQTDVLVLSGPHTSCVVCSHSLRVVRTGSERWKSSQIPGRPSALL